MWWWLNILSFASYSHLKYVLVSSNVHFLFQDGLCLQSWWQNDHHSCKHGQRRRVWKSCLFWQRNIQHSVWDEDTRNCKTFFSDLISNMCIVYSKDCTDKILLHWVFFNIALLTSAISCMLDLRVEWRFFFFLLFVLAITECRAMSLASQAEPNGSGLWWWAGASLLWPKEEPQVNEN